MRRIALAALVSLVVGPPAFAASDCSSSADAAIVVHGVQFDRMNVAEAESIYQGNWNTASTLVGFGFEGTSALGMDHPPNTDLYNVRFKYIADDFDSRFHDRVFSLDYMYFGDGFDRNISAKAAAIFNSLKSKYGLPCREFVSKTASGEQHTATFGNLVFVSFEYGEGVANSEVIVSFYNGRLFNDHAAARRRWVETRDAPKP